MHVAGPGMWQTHWKTWKWERHSVGPGISCETVKNVQNEKCTLYDLEYGIKHWKTWKMRNTHCQIWIMVWNSEKGSKWEMHTVWPGIWPKTLKHLENEKRTLSDLDYRVKQWKRFKMRNAHCLTWNMAKNTEKHGTWEMHTVGPGIWKKMKKLENVKCTLYDLKYSERHWKTLKMRIAHYRTWIMGRNLKNMQNETQTLYDLEYSRNTEKRGKGEMLTMGLGIWLENWKSWKWEMGTLPGIWQ